MRPTSSTRRWREARLSAGSRKMVCIHEGSEEYNRMQEEGQGAGEAKERLDRETRQMLAEGQAFIRQFMEKTMLPARNSPKSWTVWSRS